MQKTAVIVVTAVLVVVTIAIVAGILVGVWSASSALPIITAVLSATLTQILNKSETLFKRSEPVKPVYSKREFPPLETGFWGELRDRSLPVLAIIDGVLLLYLVYQNWTTLFPAICVAGINTCERAFVIDYGNFGLPIWFAAAVLLIWFGAKYLRSGLK